MRKLMVAAVLALIAVPAFAAVEYEFIQKNTSDDSNKPATDLTARAVVDGLRSRVDFVGGNLYPPGTWVVSTDGSRSLTFVDPVKKWYTEFNAIHAATSLGAANIKIENLKSDVQKLDDRQTVAGIDAEHYRLTLNYDITVTMRNIPLRQRVQTEIDTWVTHRFGGTIQDSFNSGGVRTGNPMVDQLLDAESGRIPGFPLRRTVTTKTFFNAPARRSELKVPTTRTMVREMWVTRIREVPTDASVFAIPATYRRADQPEQKAATQLTFEPPAN